MRSYLKLGPANLALISLYFAPVWGRDAVLALISPYSGFEDPVQAAAANYFRQMFDLGLDGLMRASNVLAAVKLVIAAGFVAYLIEFARSLAVEREPNRETIDAVLVLAVTAIAIWTLPALALDDGALVRLSATQLLLVVGALIVIMVERHVERSSAKHAPLDTPLPAGTPVAIPGAYRSRLAAWRATHGGEGVR
jgi:hypothetical protein